MTAGASRARPRFAVTCSCGEEFELGRFVWAGSTEQEPERDVVTEAAAWSLEHSLQGHRLSILLAPLRFEMTDDE
jgi:hypothetical protein